MRIPNWSKRKKQLGNGGLTSARRVIRLTKNTFSYVNILAPQCGQCGIIRLLTTPEKTKKFVASSTDQAVVATPDWKTKILCNLTFWGELKKKTIYPTSRAFHDEQFKYQTVFQQNIPKNSCFMSDLANAFINNVDPAEKSSSLPYDNCLQFNLKTCRAPAPMRIWCQKRNSQDTFSCLKFNSRVSFLFS